MINTYKEAVAIAAKAVNNRAPDLPESPEQARLPAAVKRYMKAVYMMTSASMVKTFREDAFKKARHIRTGVAPEHYSPADHGGDYSVEYHLDEALYSLWSRNH